MTIISKTLNDLQLISDIQIISDVNNWIDQVGKKRTELNGLEICPYALSNRSKIIIAELPYPDIFRIVDDFTMIIFVDVLYRTHETLKNYSRALRKINSEIIIVIDHVDHPTYVRGVQTNNGKRNTIIFQPKLQASKGRPFMEENGWYGLWSEQDLKRLYAARNIESSSDYE